MLFQCPECVCLCWSSHYLSLIGLISICSSDKSCQLWLSSVHMFTVIYQQDYLVNTKQCTSTNSSCQLGIIQYQSTLSKSTSLMCSTTNASFRK